MLLQVGAQVLDGHPIDPGRSLIALHLRQRFLQILTLDDCFHRPPCDRRAFKTGLRRACFGVSGSDALGFTLRPGARVQFNLILLPHGSREIDRFTNHFHRSGLRRHTAAYFALC